MEWLSVLKYKKTLLCFYYIFLLGVFFSLAEIIIRGKGYRPWEPEDTYMAVKPGGKLFTPHPTLGYINLPGENKVMFPVGSSLRYSAAPWYSFKTTSLSNGLRITHPLNTYGHENRRKEIWIFGCSFTYGFALNDNETYPWLLQERLPNYEIVNFGVCGYGTLHALIQFKEALPERSKPLLAVIAYGSFHDQRNALERLRRKMMTTRNRGKSGIFSQPYAEIDKFGKARYFMKVVEYTEFPLARYSAFINFLENKYNKLENRLGNSHRVSKAIIKDFHSLCKTNGIPLVVAGITAAPLTREMLDYCTKEGIMAADISVNLEIKGNRCLPYDFHPSAQANKQYARKLESFLLANRLVGG